MMFTARHGRDRSKGQALVEFSMAFIVFVVLLLAVFDLGRGIYVYNGLSQAAREVARVTSVNAGSPLGGSLATQRVVATQMGLVPGMTAPSAADFVCSDLGDTASNGHSPCRSHDFVRVTVRANYTPTLLLGMGGTFTLSSTSSLEIP